MNSSSKPETPFALMGASEDLVLRLVYSFSAYMAVHEPELARAHSLTPEGTITDHTQQRFARFLVEWLGGPARYSNEFGHPRLRMRHAHVAIDEKMRDAWLRCMTHALDEVGIAGDVRGFLDARLGEVAEFLRNRLG